MKHRSTSVLSLLWVGLLWFFLSRPAVASQPSDYYMKALTAPAEIQTVAGVLEATISIDYNIAPRANPIWGDPTNSVWSNGQGGYSYPGDISDPSLYPAGTSPKNYIPKNSASDARSQIGPDVVSLRNYTVQEVSQGRFTSIEKDVATVPKTPQPQDSSTWVTDIIGPTLRAKPGDQIILHLVNNLPDDRFIGYEVGGYSKTIPTKTEYFDAGYTSCMGVGGAVTGSTEGTKQIGQLSNATCNMTNFHTHGLHDSPADVVKETGDVASTQGTDPTYNQDRDYWISDDVIDSLIAGGKAWDIKIDIPKDHPAGTFWYHPHQHGATAVALSSGLEGTIIIDDIAPTITTQPTGNKPALTIETLDGLLAKNGITERLMMFQHLPYAAPNAKYPAPGANGQGGYVCDDNTPCEVGWTVHGAADANFAGQVFTGYTLVNGQTYPKIEMTTGDTERWRLVNGGVAEPVSLQIAQLTATGQTTLSGILDELVAPNRVPFLKTNAKGTKVTDAVVIGGITASSKAATPADKWLADTSNFEADPTASSGLKTLPLNIIAYDGITTGRIENPSCPAGNNPASGQSSSYDYYQDCVTLGPGNRADALINPTDAGTYLLLKNVNYAYMGQPQTGETSAEDIVAVLEVKAPKTPVKKPLPAAKDLLAYAQTQYYPPDPAIANQPPDQNYEGHFLFFPVPPASKQQQKQSAPTNPDETLFKAINFGFAFTCDPNNTDPKDVTACIAANAKANGSNLDKEMFTVNMQPIALNLNDVGEWTVKVEFVPPVTSAHPFHIHTNPFYIKEIQTYNSSTGAAGIGSNDPAYTPYQQNGQPIVSKLNHWQDTLLVQPNQIVTFLYQPTQFEGSLVFHCHFVDHEDSGMMRWLKICDETNKTCTTDNTYGLLPDFTKEDF
ncbi:MAG: multicopper oxidase domain-containing protein [Cyanobacteria bacterium P01_G01_bin.54]